MAGAESPNVIRPGTVSAPEFPSGLQWLNVDRPLRMGQLRGKIVLLDFWTYCCINCMHALEDVKRLERRFPGELVVIGVHSAKYDAEKNTERIREAVLRHGIEHPVVNDSEMRVWQEYAIRAWPSFMLIDPLGKVFGTHSGERVYDLFERVISQLIEHYDAEGGILRRPVEPRPESHPAATPVLSFPGKVLADGEGERLFVADTNHHRIVVASLHDGSVLDTIGSGESGFADGRSADAKFKQPQGMALVGESLYVADTGNHSIRDADLTERTVTTVVGDGRQDTEWSSAPGPVAGRRLNSPWDLETAHGVLFVAMAGNHQVFGIDLESGYIAGHAGSGREDHLDGPLLAAALAQPTGLTSDRESLFVADSEVSSIRAASLDPRGGHVRTVVGKGLFDFGDVDGVGQNVLLQHPMGVAHSDGVLYVADTYNNKIKSIALSTLTVRTLAGSGEAGFRDGSGPEAAFNEPAGLSYADGVLYVADTNNHAIRMVDVETGVVSTWRLRDMSRLLPPEPTTETLAGRAVRGGPLDVKVAVGLPEGHEFAREVASGVTLRLGDRAFSAVLADGLAEASFDLDADGKLRVEATVYYCSSRKAGACLYRRMARIIPLHLAPDGARNIAVRFETA